MKINPAHCHCKTHTGHQCPVAGYCWMKKGKQLGWMCAVHARHALRLGWKRVKTPAGAPLLEGMKTSTRYDVPRKSNPCHGKRNSGYEFGVGIAEIRKLRVGALIRVTGFGLSRFQSLTADNRGWSVEILTPSGRTEFVPIARVKEIGPAKSNPRRVPKADELRRISVRSAHLKGGITLFLLSHPENRQFKYIWHEDDGDALLIGGSSIDAAIRDLRREMSGKGPVIRGIVGGQSNPPEESWIDREVP